MREKKMAAKLKTSVSSRFFMAGRDRVRSFPEVMELIAKCGFDGVDFDFEEVALRGEGWEKEMYETANAAAKYGVAIDFGHLPFHKVLNEKGEEDPELFEAVMRRAIDVAAFLGASKGVIHPTGKPNPYTEEFIKKAFERNLNFLSPFVEYGEKKGVKLAVENMRSPKEREGLHRFGSLASELMMIVDALGVETCWDFGHAHCTSLKMQSEEIETLGKTLTVLHVNDNHSAGEDEHLLPFFGTVDWKDAMAGLGKVGYTGYFNYECRMVRLPQNDKLRENIGVYAHTLAETLIGMTDADVK